MYIERCQGDGFVQSALDGFKVELLSIYVYTHIYMDIYIYIYTYIIYIIDIYRYSSSRRWTDLCNRHSPVSMLGLYIYMSI